MYGGGDRDSNGGYQAVLGSTYPEYLSTYIGMYGRGSQESSFVHPGSECPQWGGWAPCPTAAELLTMHWVVPREEQKALNSNPEILLASAS